MLKSAKQPKTRVGSNAMETKNMDKIAKRIKDTIEDSNYNQTQMAEELEVSRRQIQRWINADQVMGIYKLKKLCQLSGVSADYILGLPEGMKRPR